MHDVRGVDESLIHASGNPLIVTPSAPGTPPNQTTYPDRQWLDINAADRAGTVVSV